MRTRSTLAVAALGIAIMVAIGGRADQSGEEPTSSATATATTHDVWLAQILRVATIRAAPVIRAGTLRLEGQAIDVDEHPIGGATITLNGTRTTVTEADGSFGFDELGAGDYAVSGEKQTYYGEDTLSLDDSSDPLILKLQRGPTIVLHVIDDAHAPIANVAVDTSGHNTSTTDRAGIARLRGCDADDISVEFNATGFAPLRERLTTGDDPAATIEHTIVLHPGAPAGGTVIDQDGKVVADASVMIQSAQSSWHESVDTDATGHWRVKSLGAGKHAVSAQSREHVPTADQLFDHDGIHPRDDLVVRVVLGARITGTVTDRNGKPVVGASVSGGGSEETDAAGHFEIAGVVDGPLDISATTKTQGSAVHHVVVTRGAHLEVNLVVVDSTIAGVVKSTRGEPIEDATVFARGQGDSKSSSSFERTDEFGHFDLGGMPPGEYEVVVERKEEQRRSHAPNAIVRTGDRKVSIVLPELAGVSGRVVLDGKPVDYFGVLVDAPDALTYGRPIVVRSTDGQFEQHDLRPGTWGVAIVGPGFVRKELPSVAVVDGKVTDLGEVVVERGRSVSGRTLDERGTPIGGATVMITTHHSTSEAASLDDALRGTRTAVSDPAGHYVIDGIEPGQSELVIQAHAGSGLAPARDLAATDSVVDLVLARTGTIDGTVANFDGANRVWARRVDTRDRYFAEVDLAGNFHVEHLPSGDYEVTLSGHNTLVPERVTVVADASVSVSFALPLEPITLAVHVIGTGLDDTYVRLTTIPTADGEHEWLATEKLTAGIAELGYVSPGTYQICAGFETCKTITVPASPQRQDVTLTQVSDATSPAE